MFHLDKDQKRIIHDLRRFGPLSRSQLAARLDVSHAALTKLSRGLLAIGMVEEGASADSSARGRPSVPLRLAASGGYAVGATAHKGTFEMALVDFTGNVIAWHHEASALLTPLAFARKVRSVTHALVERHALLGRPMLGIGIGVPGPALSQHHNRWNVVDVLPGWREEPLHDIFADALGWPLWIENDANAAALAEFYHGNLLRECANAVVLLLGYGIGAGVIVEGRLVRGEFGAGGEVGCLYPADRARPSPLDLLSNLNAAGIAITGVDQIGPQDSDQAPVIAAWLDRAAIQLEIAVNSAFAWFDPGAIVLAGPLPRAILEGLGERLLAADLVTTIKGRRPPLRVSQLTRSPITLGSALLPIHAVAGPQ